MPIQDLVRVKGLKHTFGYVSWVDRVADSDALVVQALREAGAILYVKTTMPQTGLVSRRPLHAKYFVGY
jgi:amidase